MKCVRIILTQTSANYKKEETDKNKMTYPLPPYSTVIGAIHNACGYTDTHDMNISIQGCFESMGKEPYTDYVLFNSLQDDRGILIKMNNPSMLSAGYARVAKAQKPMGNSFRKGITIDVENEGLLQEYRDLKDLNDSIDKLKKTRLKKLLEHLKSRRENYAKFKKKCDKKTAEYKEYDRKEKRIKSFENKINEDLKTYKTNNYDIPFSKFKTINKSLKYYEVLYGVKLIIHISSDETTMRDILDNICNLKSIGRSEDFVDVVEAKMVDLYDEIDKDEILSPYSAYLNIDAVRNDYIFTKTKDAGHVVSGTKYTLNKIYDIVDGKRVFEDKKRVLYASEYFIEECCEDYGVYYDGENIVSFM